MPQQCRICHHPERLVIEAALDNDETYRSIGERFDVRKDALSRHWRNHQRTAKPDETGQKEYLAISSPVETAPVPAVSLAALPRYDRREVIERLSVEIDPPAKLSPWDLLLLQENDRLR